MRKVKAKKGEKIYLIMIIVKGIYGGYDKPKESSYRVLAVPESFTLYRLAESIVDSFNFYFDHCFGFYGNIEKWSESEEGYELFADIGEESEFKGVKNTKVSKVFSEIGKKMLFLFDYGDEWIFIIELKGVESPKEYVKYPAVVESVGYDPQQYPPVDEKDE